MCTIHVPDPVFEADSWALTRAPVVVIDPITGLGKVKLTEVLRVGAFIDRVTQQDGILYRGTELLHARQHIQYGATHFSYCQFGKNLTHFETMVQVGPHGSLLSIRRADRLYSSSLLGVATLAGILSTLPWVGREFQWSNLNWTVLYSGKRPEASRATMDFDLIDIARPDEPGRPKPGELGNLVFECPIPATIGVAVSNAIVGVKDSETRHLTTTKRALQELVAEKVQVRDPSMAAAAICTLVEVQSQFADIGRCKVQSYYSNLCKLAKLPGI